MTKRQSETEPATKTVAEVAHARGRCAAWCPSHGSIAARVIAPGPFCYPVGAHARSPVMDWLRVSGGSENADIMGVLASGCYVVLFCV